MSKKIKQTVTHALGKKMGRSSGSLVVDPVLGDKTTPKILRARKGNNPDRYNRL